MQKSRTYRHWLTSCYTHVYIHTHTHTHTRPLLLVLSTSLSSRSLCLSLPLPLPLSLFTLTLALTHYFSPASLCLSSPRPSLLLHSTAELAEQGIHAPELESDSEGDDGAYEDVDEDSSDNADEDEDDEAEEDNDDTMDAEAAPTPKGAESEAVTAARKAAAAVLAAARGDDDAEFERRYKLNTYEQESDVPAAAGNMEGLMFYADPSKDPYLGGGRKGDAGEDPAVDEDDAEDDEDLRVLPTDNLIVVGRTEDALSHIEVHCE